MLRTVVAFCVIAIATSFSYFVYRLGVYHGRDEAAREQETKPQIEPALPVQQKPPAALSVHEEPPPLEEPRPQEVQPREEKKPERPIEPPPRPLRLPAYSSGDVVRLVKTSNNSAAWIVWHPREFANIKEAQRIGDDEGMSQMLKKKRFYQIKDQTKVRILKLIDLGEAPREDIYQIRILEEDADAWDRRTESKGMEGYAYAYCLEK